MSQLWLTITYDYEVTALKSPRVWPCKWLESWCVDVMACGFWKQCDTIKINLRHTCSHSECDSGKEGWVKCAWKHLGRMLCWNFWNLSTHKKTEFLKTCCLLEICYLWCNRPVWGMVKVSQYLRQVILLEHCIS